MAGSEDNIQINCYKQSPEQLEGNHMLIIDDDATNPFSNVTRL